VNAVRPNNLPTVDAHALTNSLYGQRGLRANDLIWYWQGCQPSRVREWVALAAQDARLHIALNGDAVGLGPEPRDWHRYAGEVRLLAWAAHHEPILDLLRAVFASEWLPEAFQQEASPQSGDIHAGFSIYAANGAHIVDGMAVFGRCYVAGLADRSDAREPRPHAVTELQAALAIHIDDFEMPRAELRGLAPGAVVRVDNRTLRTTPRVTIPLGTLRATADIHGTRVVIAGFAAAAATMNDPTHGVSTMSDIDHTIATKESIGPVDPDTVPVKLRFTAGRLSVPFGALASVAPGFVFELDKPLDDQVITIHANGVPIARGELVTLGDLLGVRISRMLTRP
jgi:type III secretion system YscQ/HrcQ family protein